MENETLTALKDVLKLLKLIQATQVAHQAMLNALAFTHHEQDFLRNSFETLMNDAEAVTEDPLKLEALQEARGLLVRSLPKQ